jgi:hypothetical protein
MRLAAAATATLICVALAAGCTSPRRWFTNTSTVRDNVVRLPDGGRIYVQIEQQEALGRRAKRTLPAYVWEQPDRLPKVLKVTGEAARAIDAAAATSEVSDDGNVVRLVEAGRAVATFDYVAGTATFAH